MSACCCCGGQLQDPGARKCHLCQSYQGTSCIGCGVTLPAGAARCNACSTYQRGGNCTTCGASMPTGAIRCRTCNTFNDWRRVIPKSEIVLALVVSILSLLTAAVPPLRDWWNDRSRTDVHVMGLEYVNQMDGQRQVPIITILVKATNTGVRPAMIRAAHVQLTKEVQVPMKIHEFKELYLEAGKSVDLHLLCRPVKTASSILLGDLAAHDVTVHLDVDENIRGTYAQASSPPGDEIKAKVIEGWIKYATN